MVIIFNKTENVILIILKEENLKIYQDSTSYYYFIYFTKSLYMVLFFNNKV